MRRNISSKIIHSLLVVSLTVTSTLTYSPAFAQAAQETKTLMQAMSEFFSLKRFRSAKPAIQSAKTIARVVDPLADQSAGLLNDVYHTVKSADYVATVGVQADTQKIIGKLASPDDKIIFITGPKGSGKTQFLYAIQERIVAMQERMTGKASDKLKHLSDKGLPSVLHDARIIKINSSHKFMNDADAFEGIIRGVETQLGTGEETLVFHFDSVERFLKEDNSKGVLDLVDFISRVEQKFGAHRVRFTIESTVAEKDILKGAHKLFADAQDVNILVRSIEETIQIVRPHLARIAKSANLEVSDMTLRRAAILAERYYKDLGLPNGAIKLISSAMGNRLAYIEDGSVPAIEIIEQNIKNIKADMQTVKDMNGKFAKHLREVQLPRDLKAQEKLLTETRTKYQSIFNLKAEREQLMKEVMEAGDPTPTHLITRRNELDKRMNSITEEDLALTVHYDRGVSLDSLIAREGAMTREALEEAFYATVKGQPEAVKVMIDAIENLDSIFRDKTRPINILVLGKTGTGKTFLWKVAKEIAFDNIGDRIDMGKYMSEHAVSGLDGASPGLIGFEKGGELTNSALNNPRQLRLLDEADKAHVKTWDKLLPMMDDGRMVDQLGREAHFEDSINYITMNLGNDLPPNATLAEITEFFVAAGYRPEWLNRFDDIIIANPLTDEALGGILDNMVREINREIRREFMTLNMTNAASKHLMTKLDGGLNSGRDVRRIIQREIRQRLTSAHKYGQYIDDAGNPQQLKIENGDEIVIDFAEGKGLTFRIAKAK